METFVRLTSVLGINLKPNEDIDYADEPFLPMSPMEAQVIAADTVLKSLKYSVAV